MPYYGYPPTHGYYDPQYPPSYGYYDPQYHERPSQGPPAIIDGLPGIFQALTLAANSGSQAHPSHHHNQDQRRHHGRSPWSIDDYTRSDTVAATTYRKNIREPPSRYFWLLLSWEDRNSNDHRDVTDMYDRVSASFRHDAAIVEIPHCRTRDEILDKDLRDDILRHVRNENSTLVIYYVGHGRPNSRRDTLVLANEAGIGCRSTFSLNHFVAALVAPSLGDLVLLIDCCHSGLGATAIHNLMIPDCHEWPIRAIAFIAACGAEDIADGDGLTFTQAFVNILRKVEDDRCDGATISIVKEAIVFLEQRGRRAINRVHYDEFGRVSPPIYIVRDLYAGRTRVKIHRMKLKYR